MHVSEGEKFERYIRVAKNNEMNEDADEMKNSIAADCEAYDSPLGGPSNYGILNSVAETDVEDAPVNGKNSTNQLSIADSTSSKNECYWSPFEDARDDKPERSDDVATLNLTEKPSKPNKSRDKAAKSLQSNQSKPDKTDSSPSDQYFDEVIREAMQENSRCAFLGCKQKTTVLGQDCSFCKRRFCLSHHVAECHGCGNEAKIAARKLISREGKLYSGSGVPSKALKPEKRAQLKSKLDNRLENMAEKRKGASHKPNSKK